MSFSDIFNACMERNHMPAPQELFSGKTLGETLEFLDHFHEAMENAGGAEVTLSTVATLGAAAGVGGRGLCRPRRCSRQCGSGPLFDHRAWLCR